MSEREEFKRAPQEIIEAFKPFSTCNVSDALDMLKLKCGVHGILPQPGMKKIIGSAVTMKVTAYGERKPDSHMGVDPICFAEKGDIIVIDNGGRDGENCWGEILTFAAVNAGIAGTVIDGVFRDVDIISELGYPVYARGITPSTARGRTMMESFNRVVRIGHVQVAPGDIVMGDANGIAVIPRERAKEVLEATKTIFAKEEAIVEQLKKGIPLDKVDKESNYEKMLEQE